MNVPWEEPTRHSSSASSSSSRDRERECLCAGGVRRVRRVKRDNSLYAWLAVMDRAQGSSLAGGIAAGQARVRDVIE
jgi:hypothetical protein